MNRKAHERSGRGWEIALAVIAALAAGGAGGYLIASRGATGSGSMNDQSPAKPDKVTALGRLQPASGVVPIYGPPGDRIAKLFPVAPVLC